MLKKIALATAALSALAGISFAMSNPDFIDQVPGINFKTSTNVKVAYKNDAATVPQNYAIISKHSSGDTYFATSNLSTAIYKSQDSSYMGTTLGLSDDPVSKVDAGDTTFDKITGDKKYQAM